MSDAHRGQSSFVVVNSLVKGDQSDNQMARTSAIEVQVDTDGLDKLIRESSIPDDEMRKGAVSVSPA